MNISETQLRTLLKDAYLDGMDDANSELKPEERVADWLESATLHMFNLILKAQAANNG